MCRNYSQEAKLKCWIFLYSKCDEKWEIHTNRAAWWTVQACKLCVLWLLCILHYRDQCNSVLPGLHTLCLKMAYTPLLSSDHDLWRIAKSYHDRCTKCLKQKWIYYTGWKNATDILTFSTDCTGVAFIKTVWFFAECRIQTRSAVTSPPLRTMSGYTTSWNSNGQWLPCQISPTFQINENGSVLA